MVTLQISTAGPLQSPSLTLWFAAQIPHSLHFLSSFPPLRKITNLLALISFGKTLQSGVEGISPVDLSWCLLVSSSASGSSPQGSPQQRISTTSSLPAPPVYQLQPQLPSLGGFPVDISADSWCSLILMWPYIHFWLTFPPEEKNDLSLA